MSDLRPYQQAGCDFLASQPHAILADDMGLGKTVQAIAACDTVTARRILVICPAVARENWVREFRRHSIYAREFKVLDEKPAEGQRYRDRCLVMSYDRAALLYRESDFFADPATNRFDVLILDESHYLKNPFAKRTAAIMGKTGVQACAKRIWALTGTPVTKDIGDLWVFLFSFGVIKCKYDHFLGLFCEIKPNPKHWALPIVVGLKPGANIRLKPLIARVCLRRTVEEVLPELPSVIHTHLAVERGEVEVTEEMRVAIESQTGMLVEKLNSQQAIGVLELLAKSCSTLRRYLGMQKAQPAIDLLREELGVYYEKIVVFTLHKAVAARLLDAFPGISVGITGETKASDRQIAIDRFQNDPSCKIFVGNIHAAGTAITLTAAHHILFVEEEWIPAANEQAIGRCRRIGQQHTVFVRTLTVANSIDEAVSRVLHKRKKHIGEFIS